MNACHYVNGDTAAPRRCELRARWTAGGPVELVAKAQSFTGADLDVLLRRGAVYAEYEAVSGFYVHAFRSSSESATQ